eukprot:TRINITY_DN55721_c0_g1_i1.p1 TRINITY_DN55721_c0_g1~~TRINITY_DN55721_c0_g1_i1.p1  ORF type:complete len:487 (+),score=171.20 TRINITY_DN55721_c0_g1_i1:91-1461(+)
MGPPEALLALCAAAAAVAPAAAECRAGQYPPAPSCGEGCELHIMGELAKKNGAACLDGSPPALYYRPGKGGDAARFLVYSHGGGWCYNEAECAARAKTFEGSTDGCLEPQGPPYHLELNNTRSNMMSGIMSPDCAQNPRFCNWSVAFLMYCDGSSWTSDRADTVITGSDESPILPPLVYGFSSQQLFFRGKRNLATALQYLTEKLGLAGAQDIVLSGASAGGLFSMVHCDAVTAHMATAAPHAAVHCLSDTGFFLDHTTAGGRLEARDPYAFDNYRARMRYMLRMHQGLSGLDESCVASRPADLAWQCLFGEYAVPHVTRAPVFISNSFFDSWSSSNILLDPFNRTQQAEWLGCRTLNDASRCTPAMLAIFREWRSAFIAAAEVITANPRHGAFVTSCERHHHLDGDYSFTQKVGGQTVLDTVAAWMARGPGAVVVDSCDAPGCNPTCVLESLASR